MYSHERKNEILKRLNADGSVSVNDLSEMLEASKETIRRDLRELEDEGSLLRTHGGATLDPSLTPPKENISSNQFPFDIRHTKNLKEKNEICQKAAAYINNHDTIFIDNSSTTLFLPQAIPKHLTITIITNSIKILLETAKLGNPNITLIALAGFYNISNFSVYGSRTIKSAEDFFPNKTFISCTGINPLSCLTDISLNEVDTKKAIMEKSEEVFLLADHSKFEATGPFYLSDFDAINYIVTDNYAYSPETAENIKTILSKHHITYTIT